MRDCEDQAGWREFLDTYWRLIYDVARKADLSDAEAQDLVQNTFIYLARRMPNFRYDRVRGSFKSWLRVVTRSRIGEYRRRDSLPIRPRASVLGCGGPLPPSTPTTTRERRVAAHDPQTCSGSRFPSGLACAILGELNDPSAIPAGRLACGLTAVADEDSLPTRRSLLSRLRDLGDSESWQTFFDTYWRLIYNVARKSGLTDADAQDVVQEAVIAVARKMPEFRYDPAKGSFKQWLLLVTRRRIQDHLRKLYRSLPVAQAPTPTPDAEIDAAWESEWRQNLFQLALAKVRRRANPKHYQVFDYCVLQNLPAAEVARMLGLNAAQLQPNGGLPRERPGGDSLGVRQPAARFVACERRADGLQRLVERGWAVSRRQARL